MALQKRQHRHASAVALLFVSALFWLLCSRPCDASSTFFDRHRKHSLSPRSELLTSGISGDEIVKQVRVFSIAPETAMEKYREN